MKEILQFISGILPLIHEEFDSKDPSKIGKKTSEYFTKNLQPERSKREDTIICSLPGITKNEIEGKLGCEIRTNFFCDGDAVL